MTEMKLLLKCGILLEYGIIEMGFQLEWGSKQNEIQWKKQETKRSPYTEMLDESKNAAAAVGSIEC